MKDFALRLERDLGDPPRQQGFGRLGDRELLPGSDGSGGAEEGLGVSHLVNHLGLAGRSAERRHVIRRVFETCHEPLKFVLDLAWGDHLTGRP